MDRPIFILGCTKSGTTLMRNLFDGHPDLFVIPFESHFFQNTGRGIDYSYRRTMPKNLSIDEQKEGLLDWIRRSNIESVPIADGFTVGKFNVPAAEKYLRGAQVSNERELSDAYNNTIHLAAQGAEVPAGKDFVEKSVENAEMCAVWQKLYPNARFVHILRNPYSNLVAMRKYGAHNRKGKYPRLQNAMQAMSNSYYWLYRNMKDQDNYHVVIYDELIADVEVVMKDLCSKLELSYNDTLTYPTHFGETWTGNSTSKTSYSKVSSKNVSAWKKDITPNEVDLINRYFGHVISDFGFEKMTVEGSALKPGPKERPEIWLYNRLFRYFM
jgi:protein-tyrosine sulfotransferase